MINCIGQGIWRPVLGRLHLLLNAIPLFGIQHPGCSGFSSEDLMTFVSQAFNSPNGDVRNTAIKVTTEVYRLMGAPVEKFLKGIKPVIREVGLISHHYIFNCIAHDTAHVKELSNLNYHIYIYISKLEVFD
jgi:hypothetical protein